MNKLPSGTSESLNLSRVTMLELDWLRAEAKRQGLQLSEDDLRFIQQRLTVTRDALARLRPTPSDGLEPPYRYTPNSEIAGGE